ncbi:flagellar filament capping protein FliD [Pandoraea fibrosis]|uniref:Flagellar hook-associated protein 2 n=1 Tax=Pandoraea fibrosis TaxID=1891094 RepID=A0ABX6HWQ2_9BURK|nr:flagellar filament capping protein FliD [Pandoraea fibrosis]QHE94528.1 flagellar filament capping protein FliD [Pandoraea fibrosis]QHF15366.1 flagellar filament capping protein FliD [Pandoraea fibrosis]
MATSSSAGSISSPGIGSGLDVNALVTSLMQPANNKLTLLKNQESSYQTKLSALGQLQSSLSAFQASLLTLSSASQYLQMSANVADNTILTASSTTGAAAGAYTVNVSQLAQAQSLTTSGVANQTSAIGSGTATKLTFSFGTISGGTLTDGTYSGASFAANASQQPVTITIDSSNNSLQGIRDAINASGAPVNATIVNDGSGTPYRLVLTSKTTGENMSMNITAAAGGDATITNMLTYDATGAQNLTQTAAAQNAKLTVNGLAITSATNSVQNSVQGLSLSLIKTGTTTVTMTNNSSAVTQAVQSFATAYNTLQSTMTTLTKYDPTGQATGALIGDSTVNLVQSQLQQILNGRLPGVQGNGLTSLAQIGVNFQTDGTLTVDTSALSKAMSSGNGFQQLASLLATNGISTDSLVTYNSSSSKTQPGNYAVNITQIATQGTATSSVSLPASTTITASNNQLNIMLDGNNASVVIPAGTYTPDQLATAIQSAINGNSVFSTASSGVSVTQKNGLLTITSNRYGSASRVQVTGGSAFDAVFGANTLKTGVDVQGTIGGLSAVGSGQTLTGGAGTAVDGLKLTIGGTNTGSRGTVAFSQGYASLLNNQVSDFLSTSGAISSATSSLNTTIKQIQQQESDWQDQMTQMQNRYLAQFTALDATMAKLQNTSDYLKQVLGGSSSSSSSSK